MSKNSKKNFRNVTLSLDANTIKLLNAYAEELKMSKSNIIRMLVKKYIKEL